MKTQESQVSLHAIALGNHPANTKTSSSNLSKSATEIQGWIISYLAKFLEVEPDELDVKIPFDRYGLDSSAAIGMTGELENWLGCPIDPTLIYDYPTIESFAQHLTEGA
jgi:acyl carrier protein